MLSRPASAARRHATTCACSRLPSDPRCMSADFLAIDLGAESGRAMLGRLQGGTLSLDEVCRFPNEPVRQNGALQWDILRLWLEITRGLERASGSRLQSVGVDTWGCDY